MYNNKSNGQYNMKKIIRLNEAEFKGYIRNLIKESLDEMYDDFEEDFVQSANERWQDVNNGRYDDAIAQLHFNNGYDSQEIIDALFGKYDPDYDEPLDSLINDKILTMDKKAAFKWKNVPGWGQSYQYYPRDAETVFLQRDYDIKRDKENAMNKFVNQTDVEKYPEFMKKNGDMRSMKTIKKNLMNRKSISGASVAADKKSLHRKGSLNREIQ